MAIDAHRSSRAAACAVLLATSSTIWVTGCVRIAPPLPSLITGARVVGVDASQPAPPSQAGREAPPGVAQRAVVGPAAGQNRLAAPFVSWAVVPDAQVPQGASCPVQPPAAGVNRVDRLTYRRPLETTRATALNVLRSRGYTILEAEPGRLIGEKPEVHELAVPRVAQRGPGQPPQWITLEEGRRERLEGKTWRCVWLESMSPSETRVYSMADGYLVGAAGVLRMQTTDEIELDPVIGGMAQALGERLPDLSAKGRLLERLVSSPPSSGWDPTVSNFLELARRDIPELDSVLSRYGTPDSFSGGSDFFDLAYSKDERRFVFRRETDEYRLVNGDPPASEAQDPVGARGQRPARESIAVPNGAVGISGHGGGTTEAIARIRSGPHLQMPAPRTAYASGAGKGMTIENSTGHLLRIHFGGPVIRTVDIPSGQSVDVDLTVGAYEVAAEAPGTAITPFYGTQTYQPNTHYWLKFFLSMQTG